MRILKSPAIIFIAIALTFYGCAKKDYMPLNSESKKADPDWFKKLKTPDLTPFTIYTAGGVSAKGKKNDINKRKLNGTNPGPPVLSLLPPGSFNIVGSGFDETNDDYGLYKQQAEAETFLISPEWANQIYLGAILQGSSIELTRFDPKLVLGLGSHLKPITVSTNLPVDPAFVAKTYNMRPTADIAFTRAALTNYDNNNPGKIGQSQQLYAAADTFRYYEELQSIYGYNKQTNLIFIGTGGTTVKGQHKIQKTSAVVVKFYITNFTLDMDLPVGSEGTFNQLIDPTGLDTANVFGGKDPYYVSNIAYGRMGIMVLESKESSEELNNAVQKQINILGGLIGVGTGLTDREKDILNSAEKRVALMGINGDLTAKSVAGGLDGMVDIITKSATYSKESPGIPIFFSLRHMKNSSSVKNPFDINWPFLIPYARVEYRDRKSSVVQTENSETNREYRTEKTAEAVIACYSNSSCVPGTSISPPNFLSFGYESSYRYNYINDFPHKEDYFYKNKLNVQNTSKNSVIQLSPSFSYYTEYSSYPSNPIGPTPLQTRLSSNFNLLPGQGYRIVNSGFPYMP